MSGYFLSMAKLALGIGSRVEPLMPAFGEGEGGWIETEPTPALNTTHQTEVPVSPGTTVFEVSVQETPTDPNLPHLLKEATREVHSTHQETLHERVEQHTHSKEFHRKESHTAEIREVRESLTQLLKEARTEHLRVLRETSTVHSDRETERETHTQREQILRTQIESRVDTVEKLLTASPQTKPEPSQISEPVAYDIHIGRIEVRMDGCAPTSKPEEKEPVRGALSLNEYLKLRSRGDA